MTGIAEIVCLPEGAATLHPLDLPEARRIWLWSWLVDRSAPLVATLAFIGLLLTVEGDLVGLTVVLGVPGAIWAGGRLGAWLLRREAWAYIPRHRCDLKRQAPLRWTMLFGAAGAVVFGAVAAAVMLYGQGTGGLGTGPAGRATAYGVLLAVLAGEAAAVAWRAVRRRWRSLAASLPTLTVLVVLTGIAHMRIAPGGAEVRRYTVSGFETAAVAGAVLVLCAWGLSVGAGQTRGRRPPAASTC